ncbi:hypothetical protein WMY93_034002, partial [Mugilogobius chulae]
MLSEADSSVAVTVKKLVMVSLTEVFKDVAPTYKIRPVSAAERSTKVKKETQALREFEEGLLSQYKFYLEDLERSSQVSHNRTHNQTHNHTQPDTQPTQHQTHHNHTTTTPKPDPITTPTPLHPQPDPTTTTHTQTHTASQPDPHPTHNHTHNQTTTTLNQPT